MELFWAAAKLRTGPDRDASDSKEKKLGSPNIGDARGVSIPMEGDESRVYIVGSYNILYRNAFRTAVDLYIIYVQIGVKGLEKGRLSGSHTYNAPRRVSGSTAQAFLKGLVS